MALLLVFVAATFAYAEYRNHQISRVTVKGITAVPPSGVENVLLVGNNSRCALSGQQASSFGTCTEVGGARSDVTMLLHLDPSTHRASILSIPRDLFVPIPGSSSANRVDDALNAGPQRLVQTVQEDLGIPVNHFVELNFDSFQGVVNALGGISMYFPVPVKDSYSGLDITTSGCHFLNGTEALQVVRARHMYYETGAGWQYDGLGDLSRIQRDHEFLRVLASAVSKRGVANPFTDNALIGSVAPQLQVDSAMGIGDILGLVLAFHGTDPQAVPQTTLPVVVDATSYMYKGADYGSVVLPSQPDDQQVIDQFLGVSSPPGSSVSPASVTVSVMNGTGAANQASTTASALGALGFQTVGVGDATSVGPVSETTVYYAPGHEPDAEKVLQSLTGWAVMGQGPTEDGAEVTVVTGSNFGVKANSGASSGISGPASASAADSYSSASSGSSELSPPTSATESLPSYDPRSCTASGGAGA
jgi:LCP family protein required for cell wall assembly